MVNTQFSQQGKDSIKNENETQQKQKKIKEDPLAPHFSITDSYHLQWKENLVSKLQQKQ